MGQREGNGEEERGSRRMRGKRDDISLVELVFD